MLNARKYEGMSSTYITFFDLVCLLCISGSKQASEQFKTNQVLLLYICLTFITTVANRKMK
jgi:hypothetical protein